MRHPQQYADAEGFPVEQPRPLCAVCAGPFTDDEWESRHDGEEGEDVHARCCASCGEEDR